jgi:hypothetical protein
VIELLKAHSPSPYQNQNHNHQLTPSRPIRASWPDPDSSTRNRIPPGPARRDRQRSDVIRIRTWIPQILLTSFTFPPYPFFISPCLILILIIYIVNHRHRIETLSAIRGNHQPDSIFRPNPQYRSQQPIIFRRKYQYHNGQCCSASQKTTRSTPVRRYRQGQE